MNREMKIVVKCWNCKKKFTVSASGDTSITIYKGQELSPRPFEPLHKKKRLLKTCPYCGKDNEIEI